MFLNMYQKVFDGVETAVMTFASNGDVKMDAVIDGKSKQQTGSYVIETDRERVVIDTHFKLKIISNSLVVRGGDEESQAVCGSNKTFVYVLHKVS